MATAVNEKKTVIIAARERGPGPGRYALPSSIGFMSHDCTKHMKPAYSFGRRLYDLYKSDCSPGPAYFIDPRITRHGTDGTPAYSMLERQNDPNKFKTPSPGAYSPEKVHPQGERHAARCSISSRTPTDNGTRTHPQTNTACPLSLVTNNQTSLHPLLTSCPADKILAVTSKIWLRLLAQDNTMEPTLIVTWSSLHCIL